MKQFYLSILIGSVLFLACTKVYVEPSPRCISQFVNPSGRSYECSNVAAISYTSSHCGLLPLHRNNYWVYLDSIFENGAFDRVQFDTLRITNSFRTLTDSLVWWETKGVVGLPVLMYANDSAIFQLSNRYFTSECIKDVKKSYSLFPGDSIKYLSSFDDNAAMGRSIRISGELVSPAGHFNDCILFEKNAPRFRNEKVYFKPGIGVVKYSNSEAAMGSQTVLVRKISTLLAYHIE
ncbi:MAG: hypothetical protein H7Y42_05425 [Chitinophagaceae bacterium]|nr:hypothetical protein [Chitinophagaceae bacterium]